MSECAGCIYYHTYHDSPPECWHDNGFPKDGEPCKDKISIADWKARFEERV